MHGRVRRRGAGEEAAVGANELFEEVGEEAHVLGGLEALSVQIGDLAGGGVG